jgi:hypothetical protein
LYTKKLAFKDFKDRPQNMVLHFNLTERQVFTLLVEFQAIMRWRDEIMADPEGQTPTEEVVEFYNNLETILLESYGKPSDDGLYFDHPDQFRFKDSAMFNEIMVQFVSDPTQATELLDGLLPKGLQDMVKKADANIAELAKNPNTDSELRAELERLRARVEGMDSTPGNVGTES